MPRYSIPGKPDIPVYYQSALKMFPTCEVKFKLARENYIPLDSQAIRDGNIFEYELLGAHNFSDDERKSWGKMPTYYSPKGKGSKCGTYGPGDEKVPEGLIKIRQSADYVAKEYFNRERGDFATEQAQVKCVADLGEYGLGGAFDYLGPYTTKQQQENKSYDLAIVDLKFTKTFEYSLYGPDEDFTNPWTHIQAKTYTYLHWKKTGQIIPFVRLVVEEKLAPDCFVKETLYEPTIKVFNWLEKQLKGIHQSVELSKYEDVFTPTPDPENCFSKKGVCKYLGRCEAGRNRRLEQQYSGPQKIKLEQLI